MKVTFFRILSIILLTVSCSATRANAQYSVCCPASEPNCTLPENQCNDYLEADLNQNSAENWIDRVSDVLRNSDATQQAELPVKTAPNAATPIDFDCFRHGPCGGFSTGESFTQNAATLSKRSAKSPSTMLIILREESPAQAHTPQLDAEAEMLVERLTNQLLTLAGVKQTSQQTSEAIPYWGAVQDADYSANVAHSVASETSYWDIVKNIDYSNNVVRGAAKEAISYWDVVKDIDYSANVVGITKQALSYWDAVKEVDYSANVFRGDSSNGISYWEAVKNIDYSANISAPVTDNSSLDDHQTAHNPEPAYSEYDVYDVESSYLYGCFGYESIYGAKSLEDLAEQTVSPELQPVTEQGDVSVSENTELPVENQPSSVEESTSLPFGAQRDGYLPYDVFDNQTDRDDPFEAANIDIVQKQAALSDGQKVEFEIGCPFEQESSVISLSITFEELALLPRLMQSFADQIIRALQRVDIVEFSWQANSRLEMALCGSESLTVWHDAIWAHEKSREVNRELELAELRREKILSIAQTLDLIASQLKNASNQLISLAERESHRLIGRRVSGGLNR